MSAVPQNQGARLGVEAARALAHLKRGSLTRPEAHDLYCGIMISALRAKIADRGRRALRSRRRSYWRGY
jgi:hypothetical protein